MTADNSCPECKQGKHDNCTGQALDSHDNLTECFCSTKAHGIPFKTYAGTSGWSGTDTSAERVEREDSDGTTTKRQREVYRLILQTGAKGMTVKELREETGMHHGQASSALTNLHRGGMLCRLTEKRDRCKVYVTPSYAYGRTVEPFRAKRTLRPAHELEDAIKRHLDDLYVHVIADDDDFEWPSELERLVNWQAPTTEKGEDSE